MTQPFIGQVMYVSFNFAPKNWAMCNGQLLPINQNQALFALLGTTYGGNGTVNFALPDMRSRAPVHQGQLGGSSSTYTMGEQTGAQTTTLQLNNLGSHTHSFNVSTTDGTTQEPVANIMLAHAVSDGGTMQPDIYLPSNTVSTVNLAAQTIANTGQNQPVGIIQPCLTVTCTMALFGIFPTRN